MRDVTEMHVGHDRVGLLYASRARLRALPHLHHLYPHRLEVRPKATDLERISLCTRSYARLGRRRFNSAIRMTPKCAANFAVTRAWLSGFPFFSLADNSSLCSPLSRRFSDYNG